MNTNNTIFKTAKLRVFALAVMVTTMAVGTDGLAQTGQTGVIAFRDDCTGLLYATRSDGSGRIELPLPPLPGPTYVYSQPRVLDVTTGGPLTVVYWIGIRPANSAVLTDFGLFAVQVNDVGGTLTADPPERLELPLAAGVDPNSAFRGAFPSAGDRLALVTSNVLMTAHVERDFTLKVIGLSDLIVIGDLTTIGTPDPGFTGGFTGYIDYAPGGNRIAASIYFDLWLIDLNSDHTYLSSQRLTENTDGFAEWNPSYSPDGSRIAYTGGRITNSGISARDMNIYSLDVASHTVVQVTTNRNKGEADHARNNAMWSSDSAWIGFSAYTSRAPRNSPCTISVNSEIFQIKADGSTKATKITNTNGTGAEAWPKWGW